MAEMRAETFNAASFPHGIMKAPFFRWINLILSPDLLIDLRSFPSLYVVAPYDLQSLETENQKGVFWWKQTLLLICSLDRTPMSGLPVDQNQEEMKRNGATEMQ